MKAEYELVLNTRKSGDKTCFSTRICMMTDVIDRNRARGDIKRDALDALNLSKTDAESFPTGLTIARIYTNGLSFDRVEPPTDTGYERRIYDLLQDGEDASTAAIKAKPDWSIEGDTLHYQHTTIETNDTVTVPRLPTTDGQYATTHENLTGTVTISDSTITVHPIDDRRLVDELSFLPAQFVKLLDTNYISS